MSEIRNQITIALANHPLIGIGGLCNLLSFDKGLIVNEVILMRKEGLIEMRGRYYKLKPMYKQLELYKN
jgi:hypothetical protein